jgi:Helix-turn-helix.
MMVIIRKGGNKMLINQRVKKIRQTLNMSQAKFAKALSMSNGYIAGIELEHNKVNDRIVKLICFTFHVNEEWLRTGEGSMFEEKPDPLIELASTTFKELKPVYQEYILKQIDQLLEIQKKGE